MRLYIEAVNDIGSVRSKNEDMILLGDKLIRNDSISFEINIDDLDSPFFVAVSDGMGGHNAGEVASEIVLTNFAQTSQSLPQNMNLLQLNSIFNKTTHLTHQYIKEEGAKHPEMSGMGATLLGVLFYERKIFYVSAGDSRLYRYRHGYLRQISKDHSISQMHGVPREQSHLIYNSLGGGESAFIDFHHISDIIMEDDLLMLCTDGISDMISDDLLEEHLEYDSTAVDLTNFAKQAGGKDNISLILIDFLEM